MEKGVQKKNSQEQIGLDLERRVQTLEAGFGRQGFQGLLEGKVLKWVL